MEPVLDPELQDSWAGYQKHKQNMGKLQICSTNAKYNYHAHISKITAKAGQNHFGLSFYSNLLPWFVCGGRNPSP